MSRQYEGAPDYAGHTPDTGTPWRVVSIPNNTGNRMPTWEVRGPYGVTIAAPVHRPHNFANARLIAAAPEMLDALFGIQRLIDHGQITDAYNLAARVSARATGAA